MAVDEELDQIFREALGGLPGVTEKRMMGATCFLVNGHMVGGAMREKNGLRRFLFRVGKENKAEAEAIGHGQIMEMGGRKMSGLYFVDADDCPPEVFTAWKSLALFNAFSLPPKE